IDGTLLIDGVVRGKLPLLAPVRVMPGKHVVRVLRDGFATFERSVEVKAGEKIAVDAKLEALTSAGRLHVVGGTELEGGTLLVDGVAVGPLPWEGTLAPGAHLVQAIKGDVGTAPTLVNVIASQTVDAPPLVGKPLGPARRVLVDPPTAELSIDGVPLGKGRWQGRLPIGEHVVEARELGYFAGRLVLQIDDKEAAD